MKNKKKGKKNMRKNTKGKCEKFIEKNTGYTLSGGTPFDTVKAMILDLYDKLPNNTIIRQ